MWLLDIGAALVGATSPLLTLSLATQSLPSALILGFASIALVATGTITARHLATRPANPKPGRSLATITIHVLETLAWVGAAATALTTSSLTAQLLTA